MPATRDTLAHSLRPAGESRYGATMRGAAPVQQSCVARPGADRPSPTGLLFRLSDARCGRITIGRREILRALGIGTAILGTAWARMAAAASARNGADLTVPVFVIATGWHTELALPVESLRGRLAHFADAFPGARFLVFGWGQRDYYMAREPTIGDLLGATLPSPAVTLVVPLRQTPTNAYGAQHVFSVEVSEQGANVLSSFIWRFLAAGAEGRPVRIAPGPDPQSAFYASSGTYSPGYPSAV